MLMMLLQKIESSPCCNIYELISNTTKVVCFIKYKYSVLYWVKGPYKTINEGYLKNISSLINNLC